MRAALQATMSSDRPDWNTPTEVLRLLHAGWPDGVDLDPCSNATSIVDARQAYTEDDDGLEQPWQVPTCGLIYVNPPYGRPLPAWAQKIQRERNAAHTIVTLIPARTDTGWWRTLVTGASHVIFLAGRLRFLGAPASAPFPSALVVHCGANTSATRRMLRTAEDLGHWVVRP